MLEACHLTTDGKHLFEPTGVSRCGQRKTLLLVQKKCRACGATESETMSYAAAINRRFISNTGRPICGGYHVNV